MVEKFVWNSAKDALDDVGLTLYEQKNNITIVSSEIVKDFDDIKIAEMKKSDGSVTFVILFRKALKLNLWDNWIPTKNQFNVLMEIGKFIDEIESRNKDARFWQNGGVKQ